MWLSIFENGDYPVIDKNTNPSYRPDAEIWIENKHARVKCYLLHDNYIYFGHYKSPFCFVAYKVQDIEKTYQEFQEHKKRQLSNLYTQEDLENIAAKQWMYIDMVEPERFYEDSEVINEGVLTITKYFDNNSLKEKEVIDLETGECLYYMRYTMSQYWSPTHEREISRVTELTRTREGKRMDLKLMKDNYSKQYRWIFQYPLSYKGLTMEKVYGQHKNTHRRNSKA